MINEKREWGSMCEVMVIRKLGEKCIQTDRDNPDVLRHIIREEIDRV
jgi:hypothetical protein